MFNILPGQQFNYEKTMPNRPGHNLYNKKKINQMTIIIEFRSKWKTNVIDKYKVGVTGMRNEESIAFAKISDVFCLLNHKYVSLIYSYLWRCFPRTRTNNL